MERYPIRFQPILKERVWGGSTLATRLGRKLPSGVKVGEAWEIVDRPDDTSRVVNGPLAGRTLDELCKEYGPELLGKNAPRIDKPLPPVDEKGGAPSGWEGRRADQLPPPVDEKGGAAAARERAPYGGRFPLILKLLDPQDKLSVQVHPTGDYVARHPEAEAVKNEMWYALHAEPGAQIIHGLVEGATLEELEKALAGGDPEPLFRFVPVEQGAFYYMPSGLIHALLPGSLMVEIQQNSDTTFRLYDWKRPGLDGKPREVHVAEALETAASFLADPALAAHEVLAPARLADGVERVAGLHCPFFHVEELRIAPGEARVPLDPESFTIVVAVRGALTVACAGSAAISTELGVGDSALIPAGVGALAVTTSGGGSVLTTILPRRSGTRG